MIKPVSSSLRRGLYAIPLLLIIPVWSFYMRAHLLAQCIVDSFISLCALTLFCFSCRSQVWRTFVYKVQIALMLTSLVMIGLDRLGGWGCRGFLLLWTCFTVMYWSELARERSIDNRVQ